MPPLERAAQPTELSAQDVRRVAFIVAHGAVAYDYEDPEAARQFDRHRTVVSVDIGDGDGDNGFAPPPRVPQGAALRLPDGAAARLLEFIADPVVLLAAQTTCKDLAAVSSNAAALGRRRIRAENSTSKRLQHTEHLPFTALFAAQLGQ